MCKRDSTERAEDVDRLVGLGSSRWAPKRCISEQLFKNKMQLLLHFIAFHCILLHFIAYMQSCGPWMLFLPPSGSAGRVMLSKEDKEAAKMGLSVFTVRWG